MFAAPGAYLAVGQTNAWRLVGDSAHGGLGAPLTSGFYVQDYKPGVPGWDVTVEKTSSNPGSVANAEQWLRQAASYQSWSAYEIAPYINYSQTSFTTANTNFSALALSPYNVPDRTLPGMSINRNVDGFVMLAKGTVYIPAAGTWTFGVNSDDGWEVDFKSAAGFAYHNENGAVSNPSIFTVNFPTAGDYSTRFVWYEGSGGAYGELYAAQGTWGSFAATGAWRLVGDTANGGLQVSVPDGFDVTTYKSAGTIAGLTQTNNTGVAGVISYSSNQSWTRREVDPYINFNENSGGHFQSGQPGSPLQNIPDVAPPGMDLSGGAYVQDINNYVIQAKGSMYIPAAGQYTFGVNSDDGFSFQIINPNIISPTVAFTADYGDVGYTAISSTTNLNDTLLSNHGRGATDSLGVANFTQPGWYQIELRFMEMTGGAHVELFSAPGAKTAWDNTFTLVGDWANGGLVVTKPIGWDVQQWYLNGAPSGIANTEARIWDPTSYATLNNTQGPRYEVAPSINYYNYSDNNPSGDFSFNNYTARATATVTIPAAGGTYTFGVSNDGGFRLTISHPTNILTLGVITSGNGSGGSGTTSVNFYANANRGVGDTWGQVIFPATTDPTAYTFQLDFYHNTGGNSVELYGRLGADTGFNSGARLVGDSAGGGLPIAAPGWAVTAYAAIPGLTINTLALSDTLRTDPGAAVVVRDGKRTVYQLLHEREQHTRCRRGRPFHHSRGPRTRCAVDDHEPAAARAVLPHRPALPRHRPGHELGQLRHPGHGHDLRPAGRRVDLRQHQRRRLRVGHHQRRRLCVPQADRQRDGHGQRRHVPGELPHGRQLQLPLPVRGNQRLGVCRDVRPVRHVSPASPRAG